MCTRIAYSCMIETQRVPCKSGGCFLCSSSLSRCRTPQALEILPASDQARRVRHFVLADCVRAVSCGKNGMLVFRNAETSPSQLARTITHFGEQWILAGAMKLDCLFVE